MIPLNSKFKRNPDVLVTSLSNGEAVLLHMGTKSYYSLNETGSHIWKLIGEGLTLDEISHGIVDEFNVDLEVAKESARELAIHLVEEKLVLLNVIS